MSAVLLDRDGLLTRFFEGPGQTEACHHVVGLELDRLTEAQDCLGQMQLGRSLLFLIFGLLDLVERDRFRQVAEPGPPIFMVFDQVGTLGLERVRHAVHSRQIHDALGVRWIILDLRFQIGHESLHRNLLDFQQREHSDRCGCEDQAKGRGESEC